MVEIALPLRVIITDDSHAVVAAQYGRRLAQRHGFSIVEMTALATAILEIARNIAKYAGRGELILDALIETNRVGIRVLARDEGPGIPDLEQAMSDGYSTGRSLGLGLPGARRLMDTFDIQSDVRVGTQICMEKWHDVR